MLSFNISAKIRRQICINMYGVKLQTLPNPFCFIHDFIFCRMRGRTADSEGLAIHVMQPGHIMSVSSKNFKSTVFSLLKKLKYRYCNDGGKRIDKEGYGVF